MAAILGKEKGYSVITQKQSYMMSKVIGLIVLFLLNISYQPALVNAEGKIVEFTVANLASTRVSNKFRVQLNPEWAPIGVERFEELTKASYWDNTKIFRVITNFISQFGINSDPSITQEWKNKGTILDDPVVANNDRGTITFATSGPNSRTTQVFINTNDNRFLDDQGFAPFGEVLPQGDGYGGMEVVDAFFNGYGEAPEQYKITTEGDAYLNEEFPNLSYIVSTEFVTDDVEEEVVTTTTTTIPPDWSSEAIMPPDVINPTSQNELIGASYCYSPADYDCYAEGVPICCKEDPTTCDASASPSCDTVIEPFPVSQEESGMMIPGSSYCLWGVELEPAYDCYMDGYPSCCEARECTTVEPPPCDLVNNANATTETTGNVTTSSGGEEVDGASYSGADWLLGDKGSESGSSSAAILFFNHGYMISILLAGIGLFV